MEKTKAEIREDLLATLASKTGINTTEEGSIAIALVDTVLDEIYQLYYEVNLMRQQAYLSTSSGLYTEMIGELVDVKRNTYETDSSYKSRIQNAIHTHAGGNRISIEEAALSVAGVASIDYRPYGAGTGSFVVYVYPETGVNQVRILDNVKKALEEVVSEGIYFEVRQPTEIPVDIAIVVQFKEKTTAMTRQEIRNTIRQKLTTHLNALAKDQVLYINELIQLSMETSPDILDMSIMEIKLANQSKTIANLFPGNDERFISGTISVS